VYHYNAHQIIETRDGSGTMVSQVYHGTRYIDEVVGLRLPEGRAYIHQGERSEREPAADQFGRRSEQGRSRQAGEPARRKPRTMRAPGGANYNVIGLTDLTGRVLERYYYSPYGELEVAFDAHFFDYDDDGDVDEQDLAAATSGGECWGDYSGDCRRLDADADRDIDAADYAAISNFLAALSGDQEIQRVPAPTHSKLGNPFAHQALVFDSEIGSYQNRDRQYNPHLKRFMQRDPFNTIDGLHLYIAMGSNPFVNLDPMGTCPTATAPTILVELQDIIDAAFERGIAILIEVITSLPIGTVYGPAFSHCLSHCLITRAVGEDDSEAVGGYTESAQAAECRLMRCLFGSDYCSGTCNSARQQSDYWDNELGRQVAAGDDSCYSGCKAAMGGATTHPEGPGTARPYGPYGCPAPQDSGGGPDGPMPPGWGP
jgi:RHS repeat-associated protein